MKQRKSGSRLKSAESALEILEKEASDLQSKLKAAREGKDFISVRRVLDELKDVGFLINDLKLDIMALDEIRRTAL